MSNNWFQKKVEEITIAVAKSLAEKGINVGESEIAGIFEHVKSEMSVAGNENHAKIKEMIDIAKELEGLPRHTSTHAAGVVISDLPVAEYVPLSVKISYTSISSLNYTKPHPSFKHKQ